MARTAPAKVALNLQVKHCLFYKNYSEPADLQPRCLEKKISPVVYNLRYKKINVKNRSSQVAEILLGPLVNWAKAKAHTLNFTNTFRKKIY